MSKQANEYVCVYYVWQECAVCKVCVVCVARL